MSETAMVTLQKHQDEFSFLGIENVVTDASDFGQFWGHFFEVGGYDKIAPFALDTKPVNIWYTNSAGDKIYFQCLPVGAVDEVPEGYSLVKFPASDFLIITNDWLPTSDMALEFGIEAGQKRLETIAVPEGYVRYDGPGSPITLIEKENFDTPEGSRYEFWLPIRKAD